MLVIHSYLRSQLDGTLQECLLFVVTLTPELSYIFIIPTIQSHLVTSQAMKGFHFFITLHLFLLSSSTFFPVITATNETDVHALLSFKSLIFDDPFGVFSSWNNTLPHCQWPGVVCGRRQPDRVIAVVLDSKELSGHISPSLANLTFLQMLSLSNNKLTGSIPEELGHSSRLRFINLTMNFLDGSIPSTLGNCSNLEVLTLKSNNLGGNIPVNLANCKKLSIMSLRKNELVGSIHPEFGSLHQLSILVGFKQGKQREKTHNDFLFS
jgi:Leucine rich repeat N-terminal domain